MPAIEDELSVDVHLILVVDLADLLTAPLAPIPRPADNAVTRRRSTISARLPAFVIQGARNLLTESDGSTARKLRFAIGPIESETVDPATDGPATVNDWSSVVTAIRRSTDRPVVLLYAPVLPQIVAGTVISEDSGDSEFEAMRLAAEAAGLIVVDLRRPLLDSMLMGKWPHGFHNGFIGSGHLNANGNHVVARGLVEVIRRASQKGSGETEKQGSETNRATYPQGPWRPAVPDPSSDAGCDQALGGADAFHAA